MGSGKGIVGSREVRCLWIPSSRRLSNAKLEPRLQTHVVFLLNLVGIARGNLQPGDFCGAQW